MNSSLITATERDTARCSILILLFFILNPRQCMAAKNEYVTNSPDKKILVILRLTNDKAATYKIKFDGKTILQESKLGIIRADENFSKNLSLESVSAIELVKDEYEMIQGKKRLCSYTANKRVFHFKNESGKNMDVIFQVSNDGVGFRYLFAEKSDDVKKITEETTSFCFPTGTKAWIQPMMKAGTGWCNTQPSYEEYYKQGVEINKLVPNKPGWVLPALFCFDKSRKVRSTPNGGCCAYWILITETAPDGNYCGCRLIQRSAGNELFIGFADEKEIYPGGPARPESTLPWQTPWRIIAIGNGLKAIVESTLGTDLATPAKLNDASYVKPGRASWSWVLLKDSSVVYDVQKRFIDFAADMGWEYCLIDADWDTRIGYEKISELAEYAKGKGVGLILWYNSSGDWNTTAYHPKSKLLTREDREKEFGRLKKMGIKGIKVDFFAGDGQSMMAYYQDIFKDAAEFGLVVNCHGATIPRGWHRTYPNLLTMEAVRGFEYVTFDQSNANLEPTHCCMLPFTRNVFDPMDFTPVCFSEVQGKKRVTTNGFELALAVIFWSGIQHYADTPEGMTKVPDYVKSLMNEIPSHWEDSRFVEGYPGKLVIIARKSKNAWFVAAINGENTEKNLKLNLPFIKKNSDGLLITDGADNRSFEMQQVALKGGQTIEIKLKGNGGFVTRFSD